MNTFNESDFPNTAEKSKDKYEIPLRLDKDFENLFDLIISARSVLNNNKNESRNQLIKNLLKEEWIRLRSNPLIKSKLD